MPEERALSPVHCQEAPGTAKRGQHEHTVPMSSWPHLPAAPHGARRHRRQELHGGGHQNLQRLLHILNRRLAISTGLVPIDAQHGSAAAAVAVEGESTNANLTITIQTYNYADVPWPLMVVCSGMQCTLVNQLSTYSRYTTYRCANVSQDRTWSIVPT
jgi:hypothetical protein